MLKQILSVALQLLAMNQHVKIIYGIAVGLDSEKRIFSEKMRKEGKRGY